MDPLLSFLSSPAVQAATYLLSVACNVALFLTSDRARAWYHRRAADLTAPPALPPAADERHSLAHR